MSVWYWRMRVHVTKHIFFWVWRRFFCLPLSCRIVRCGKCVRVRHVGVSSLGMWATARTMDGNGSGNDSSTGDSQGTCDNIHQELVQEELKIKLWLFWGGKDASGLVQPGAESRQMVGASVACVSFFFFFFLFRLRRSCRPCGTQARGRPWGRGARGQKEIQMMRRHCLPRRCGKSSVQPAEPVRVEVWRRGLRGEESTSEGVRNSGASAGGDRLLPTL